MLLDRVRSPADLRAMPAAVLPALAEEVRACVVEAVCRTGGHLGPNLGAVELTLAVHRVFTSPHDLVVWDTGHQAYVHKLLTGRRAGFARLRQAGGLSGYPSRAESEHDLVENSHASTSLSYADGLAKGLALRGETGRRSVVAVVGDGALTGGMCWEALNNIGAAPQRPVVVVLNDNGRSYAPTAGAVAASLRALRAGADPATSVFAALGLDYVGPVDGHDVAALEAALRTARERRRPVVVHCVTVKGRGYPPAERDEADCLHGVGALDVATGRPLATGSALPWSKVFADEVLALARRRPDVVGVSAAMLRPVGLQPFADAFPDRVFDVGIAEQHAVTSAAGLAMAGLHPVVCLYGTFLNRAFDQVLMDVALHRLPVTFVLDRCGVTGPDGPSHHGQWDLAVLSAVPGMRVAAPRDTTRLRELLREAVDDRTGPTTLRYPKATAPDDVPAVSRYDGVDVLRDPDSTDVLLLAAGAAAKTCLAAAGLLAARGVDCCVADPRWLLPVSRTVCDLAAAHRLVVTVEDGIRAGGFGAAVALALADADLDVPLRQVGLPRRFLPHGGREEVLTAHGLSADAVADTVLAALSSGAPAAAAPLVLADRVAAR